MMVRPWTVEHLGSSIDEHFRNVARSFGDRPALVEDDSSSSYSTLDGIVEHRAATLSRSLPTGRTQPPVVALYFDQGTDATATLLAVWRAGACALCLDPALPRNRIEQLIRDAPSLPMSLRHRHPIQLL